MTTQPTLPRRNFIKSSAALLALPWFESLARADEPAVAPKRLVCICTAFGLYGPSFFPKAGGKEYEHSEYTQILGDLRSNYTVFSGISHPEIGGDHASESCFLTSAKHPTGNNFRNTVSLDFVASRHVGNATRFPLLSLSTDDAFPLTHTFSGAGVQGLNRPSDIFARMFLSGKKNEVDAEMARLKHGQSIMDRMSDRLSSLKNKLGRNDQQQLTDYTDAVREMEKQLHANEEWVLKPKPTVNEAPPKDNLDKSDFIGRAKLLFGLSKLALQTDSTRVVSIFIRGMDLKPPIEGITQDHHSLSHHGRSPGKIDELRLVERTEMSAFREFLVSLRDTKESKGSLLDQTQVLIGSNLGDASGHGTSNLPILLAGGGWKHGQHIAGDTKNNLVLGKLFVSMLQKFGVETDTFGSGKGTMDGLA